jgi:hypothetical protein
VNRAELTDLERHCGIVPASTRARMPGRRAPVGLWAWMSWGVRWRWLRWRWLDARADIAYWTRAGVPHDRMVTLREYEEQLACELAAMEADRGPHR